MKHPLDFVDDAMARRAIMDATDIVMVHGSLDGFRHAIREARTPHGRSEDYTYAVKVAATIAELAKLDPDDVARIMKEEKNR